MFILYGIKNCDTVKKARQWLDAQQINYSFHDYKLKGVSLTQLQIWAAKLGWQALLNTRGTTWRRLSPASKLELNEERALELMLNNPSLIKRPLLALGDNFYLGFNELDYQAWLQNANHKS